ncbi:MAG: type II toxin-antitoxin system VapC family toxin [Candidatus Aenigmarchaeota archaeon]|nr:type II toxin-antitoxin system VapC family toxin [Candidatus Aenigmarchaeota archaeon]
MLYLDANVFIFAQISPEKEGISARLILKAMEEGKFKAITNILAVDEVVWKIKKEIDYPLAIKVGKAMFELPNLEIVEVTPETLKEAFNFMEKYELMLRDSIHVSSMLENNVSTIVTEDPNFKRVKEIKTLTISEFARNF